jgi:cardiolipin synthase A/B
VETVGAQVNGWVDALLAVWQVALAIADVMLAGFTSAHIVLTKRDARAALLWVGLVWLAPFVGPALYLLLGVNRIKRRERALERARAAQHPAALPSAVLERALSAEHPRPERSALEALALAGDRIVKRPLLDGNAIHSLENGDLAFPAMIEAIDRATRSIALCTYIFDLDRWGQKFVDALAAAQARGVQVRVLIDAVGARYGFPKSAPAALLERGVPTAKFLALRLPLDVPFMNMRDHRKLLIVDGAVAFTGGMNIREGHVLGDGPSHPVKDLQFRVEGPVVAQLFESFAEDWRFTTKEQLEGDAWRVDGSAKGALLARVITDGPDEDFERLRWMYIAAVNAARAHVRIVTPYFVPDQGLLGVLAAAALRGVAVEIVLPERSNLRVVDWATRALLWQVLEHGCRVFLTPAPFDHSKLLVVDHSYVMFGSGNWDARTTRLNFELDVESFGASLVDDVGACIDARIAAARELGVDELRREHLLVRLRNGVARLLSPYL